MPRVMGHDSIPHDYRGGNDERNDDRSNHGSVILHRIHRVPMDGSKKSEGLEVGERCRKVGEER